MPKIKLWIEKNNEPVFGEGRLKLLKEIEKYGSISRAAAELQMSYRAAWGKIKVSENRLGKKLLNIKKGGVKGGGAKLTPYAKELMNDYLSFKQAVLNATDINFKKSFK